MKEKEDGIDMYTTPMTIFSPTRELSRDESKPEMCCFLQMMAVVVPEGLEERVKCAVFSHLSKILCLWVCRDGGRLQTASR